MNNYLFITNQINNESIKYIMKTLYSMCLSVIKARPVNLIRVTYK